MMNRTKFEVLSTVDNSIDFNTVETTLHWSAERMERHSKIQTIIGTGSLVKSFLVDTGHTNGLEIHNLFDNGIILIQNYRTERMVTELIARPAQVRRYWIALHTVFPRNYQYIIDKAQRHMDCGYNNW